MVPLDGMVQLKATAADGLGDGAVKPRVLQNVASPSLTTLSLKLTCAAILVSTMHTRPPGTSSTTL